MKAFKILVICLMATLPCLGQENQVAQQQSQNRSGQFSPQEYWKAKRQYMVEKAGLTESEAQAFFPIYTEMWQKKHELNRKVREQQQLAQKSSCSNEESLKALELILQTNIRIAHIEKEYLEKFKAIVPATKLLKLKYADEEFNTNILKDIQKSKANEFQNTTRHSSPAPPAA